MRNWTIRARIAVSFAVILALMIVTAGVAYTRLMRIEQLTDKIDYDDLPGLYYSTQIVVDRITNYSNTEEYVLQTDPAAEQKLQAAILSSRNQTQTTCPAASIASGRTNSATSRAASTA